MKNKDPKLSDSIQFIKGVGPARAADFIKLEINTVNDILFTFPRRISDRSQIISVNESKKFFGKDVSLQVVGISVNKSKRGKKEITTVIFGDDTGTIAGVWFNATWIEEQFIGREVIIFGKLQYRNGQMQITHPKVEFCDEGKENVSVGKIVPVYPLTGNLNQGAWLRIMKNVLAQYLPLLDEFYPEDFLQKRQLMSRQDAVRNMHFPDNIHAADMAKQRLIYDECLLMQLGILFTRHQDDCKQIGRSFKITRVIDERVRAILPFKLTNGQETAVAEIIEDMKSPKEMHRLLQGDVGSGKTAVAFYITLCAVANKTQVVIMAPTELLARQHEQTFTKFLSRSSKSKVRIALLTGGMKKSVRQVRLASISSGSVDIIISTHATLQEDVHFADLGLIIIDEQHKFGVSQRAALKLKGNHSDVLVMTATPIPRSLALTVYGDLDISTIKGSPPGRKKVKTMTPDSNKWRKIWDFLRKEFNMGRQAYIVSPLVEENENLDLHSAIEAYEALRKGEFSSFNVGLLHGKMKRKEQDEVMRQFREGKIDALVSTVVIEVGVDIPNATIMVVLHADRFGLAQLHQLRGRVSRGSNLGYCILMTDSKNTEAKKRLQILVESNDGFRIAEEDLAIRGEGEFLGTKQHGRGFKLTNLVTDFEILKTARDDALKILKSDPELKHKSHQAIKKELINQHGHQLIIAGSG